MGKLLDYVGAEQFPEFHHPLLMAGGVEKAALVPPRRDFRSASTRRPGDIHGGNRGTLPGQARGVGRHIPDGGQ